MNALIYCLVYPILYIISRLPFLLLYILSDGLCFIIYRVFGYRKKVVRSNLKLTFPNLNKNDCRDIERNFYGHLVDLFLEIIKSMSMEKHEMLERFHVKNIEVLRCVAALLCIADVLTGAALKAMSGKCLIIKYCLTVG